MTRNLLEAEWLNLDSAELRLLLDEHVGGPGQYDSNAEMADAISLPLAGSACQVRAIFRDGKIAALKPGQAFDEDKWRQIKNDIEQSLLAGPEKVGREYTFSSFRISGSWRGRSSGVQILPPPSDAPSAKVEIAQHPFILEFPMMETRSRSITNHRRIQIHRKLTHLLNILLNGRISLMPRRPAHFWARIWNGDRYEVVWVQEFSFAKLGKAIADAPSNPCSTKLEEIDPDRYYALAGHDGGGLRVPADLDGLLCQYMKMTPQHKYRLDRAAYWIDVAARQWTISVSSSFASLVTAVESLTGRGSHHQTLCTECGDHFSHEVPGATKRFQNFLERYAPGNSLAKQRSKMYALRSGILHGSSLMQLDLGKDFGWDPPYWNERELHDDLWVVARIALRNWLKDPD